MSFKEEMMVRGLDEYTKFAKIGVEKLSKTIEDKQICEYLDIEMYDPVLKRTKISYDDAGNVVECSICYYRADKYKYSVEIGF